MRTRPSTRCRPHWGEMYACEVKAEDCPETRATFGAAQGRQAHTRTAEAARVDAFNAARRQALARRSVRLLHVCAGDRGTDPATRSVLPVQHAAAETAVGIRDP